MLYRDDEALWPHLLEATMQARRACCVNGDMLKYANAGIICFVGSLLFLFFRVRLIKSVSSYWTKHCVSAFYCIDARHLFLANFRQAQLLGYVRVGCIEYWVNVASTNWVHRANDHILLQGSSLSKLGLPHSLPLTSQQVKVVHCHHITMHFTIP